MCLTVVSAKRLRAESNRECVTQKEKNAKGFGPRQRLKVNLMLSCSISGLSKHILAEAVTLVPSTPPSIKSYQTVSLANGGGDFQIEIWLFCVSL
jgi:hypothetical protein